MSRHSLIKPVPVKVDALSKLTSQSGKNSASFRNRQLNEESDMDWIFGSLFGASILLPLFVMVCRAEKPADKEDAKTLMGALD